MTRIKIRHLVAKRQKDHTLLYWQPSLNLRQAGFQPRRLAEKTNSLVDAIREAEMLNAEVDRWREGRAQESFAPNTLPLLIREYRQSPDYNEKADDTRRSYDQNLEIIERWSARAGHPEIDRISRRAVSAFKNSMAETPYKANAAIRILRLLLNIAVDAGQIEKNPAANPKLLRVNPRQVIWTPEAEAKFLSCATEPIRLAFTLAIYTAQRQADILALKWSQYDGSSLNFRQQKTGKPVKVPCYPALKAALDTADRKGEFILTTATGRPFKADHFRHAWRRTTLMAGIDGLRFMDLRRTAMVRLAEASATAIEIAAVSGHTIDRTQKILETYIPPTVPMAKAAITKLVRANRQSSELEG